MIPTRAIFAVAYVHMFLESKAWRNLLTHCSNLFPETEELLRSYIFFFQTQGQLQGFQSTMFTHEPGQVQGNSKHMFVSKIFLQTYL